VDCIKGLYYRQLVSPLGGTNVPGHFADGQPALTEYKNGLGRAIWIGTYSAACFETLADGPMGRYLAGLFDPTGYADLSALAVNYGT
jgi:hypothetical protein